MSNQKNIDRLFQEKLQHFEQQPRPEVWNQIQGRMAQKKKRRLPFWWLYAGAAILIIGFFVFSPKDPSNQNIKIDPVITDAPKNQDILDTVKKNNPQKPFLKKEPLEDNNTLLTEKTEKEKTQPINKKNTPKKSISSESMVAEILKKEDSSTQKENPSKNKEKGEVIKKKEENRKEPIDKFIIKKEEKNTGSKSLIDITKKIDSSKKKLIDKKKKDFVATLNEEIKEDVKKTQKWSVRPLVAFSSIVETSNSPTDRSFSNNPTSGETSLNYGVSVSYQVNEKLSIQTGVITQNMSFNTQDVAIVGNTNAINSFSNINLNSGLPFFLSGVNNSEALSSDSFIQSANVLQGNAEVNQVIGYIEIPVEAKYRVYTSKKISSSVVGGFSSLFLNKNEINLVSNVTGKTNIGTANNLNSINFSGNVGLDLDYAINDNLSLNVNPMVKVHLNTFSRENSASLPLFIGVYSGVKYRF